MRSSREGSGSAAGPPGQGSQPSPSLSGSLPGLGSPGASLPFPSGMHLHPSSSYQHYQHLPPQLPQQGHPMPRGTGIPGAHRRLRTSLRLCSKCVVTDFLRTRASTLHHQKARSSALARSRPARRRRRITLTVPTHSASPTLPMRLRHRLWLMDQALLSSVTPAHSATRALPSCPPLPIPRRNPSLSRASLHTKGGPLSLPKRTANEKQRIEWPRAQLLRPQPDGTRKKEKVQRKKRQRETESTARRRKPRSGGSERT